jgi:hypothetical protein
MRKVQKGRRCATVAVTIMLGWAQERFDMKVREDFFAGYAGDTARLERGMDKCEQELKRDPKNPPALVWHGGGLLFRAGDLFRAGEIDKGIQTNQRGMTEMNDGVRFAPDSLETRIPRGAILISSARFVNDPERAKLYLKTGIEDYEKVLELEQPDWAQRSAHGRGELLGGLADAYRRMGQQDKALQLLNRMASELPGTVYEKQARRWMANLNNVSKQERFCLGCHTSN